MRLRKNKKERLFILIALLLFITFYSSSSFAAPGVKITSPKDGLIVIPGQKVTVKIEAVDGFRVKRGLAGIASSPNHINVTSLPVTFTDNIPAKSIGKVIIDVLATDAKGEMVGDSITLNVQQTATLQSLDINQHEIWVDVDWDGNIKASGKHSGHIVTIYGIYSDGVTRILNEDPNTIYMSSDPSIISIDTKGHYQVYKVNEASVTVSNSKISKTIPVIFNRPLGMKPSETIPPIIQATIQPSANPAGWYNKDITITLTATDNEGGSGIKEISHQFPYITARPTFENRSQVVIPFSEEGDNLFRYYASDNEGNESERHEITIRLDKTPPLVSLSLEPYKIGKKLPFKQDGCNFFMPFFYKLAYSATDKLSGIKDARGGLVIPDIKDYKTRLIKRGRTQIAINETTKSITITAPNPQVILDQMKAYKLLPIDNNQVMHLNEKPKKDLWMITKANNILLVTTPSILFRAQAVDNADNIATKDVKYIKTKIPLPDYVRPLINKKELTPEEIDDLEEDAIIDANTLKIMRKNYGKT